MLCMRGRHMAGWAGFWLYCVVVAANAAAMVRWENRTIRKAESLSRQGKVLSPAMSAIAENRAMGLLEDHRNPGGRTTRDVVLARRARWFLRIVLTLALVVAAALIAYVMASDAPLDTQVQFGTYRHGHGPRYVPAWYAMLFVFVVAAVLSGCSWMPEPGRRKASTAGRRARPRGSSVTRGARISCYVGGPFLAAGTVVSLLDTTQEVLSKAGLLPG